MRTPQAFETPLGDASSHDAPATPLESAAHAPAGPPLVSLDAPLFKEVNVELAAKLGRVTLPVAELLALKAGAVMTLDARLNDLVELRLGQTVVARGEIVAVGEHFGVRIVDVAKL